MSNYTATIVKIDNIRKHENADRLSCTNIFGNNVIVGIDTKVGDIGIYFPCEAQLGEEFAIANDLIRRKDENGKSVGGMFDSNRRVRAQTFRGEKSMGFWIPINSLNKTFDYVGKPIPSVKVGDDFEELDGIIISQKYTIPRGQQSQSNGKKGKTPKISRLVDGQFHFHFETSQLGKNIWKVKPDSLISLTWKLHGTSFVVSNVLVKKNLKWYEKILKNIGIDIVDQEYGYLFSSRKVIKNSKMKEYNHFYGCDIWTDAGKEFEGKLHKGESIYEEIVGFTPNGNCIQKGYDYGCKQNERDVYIYRITQTNSDGIVFELPWHQVVHRAKEIGSKTVPEIYYGRAYGLYSSPIIDDDSKWQKEFFNDLMKTYVYDQDSQFCKNKVPEEGIVLRIENGDGIENLKLKSFKFLKRESSFLDKGENDMEESGEEIS